MIYISTTYFSTTGMTFSSTAKIEQTAQAAHLLKQLEQQTTLLKNVVLYFVLFLSNVFKKLML